MSKITIESTIDRRYLRGKPKDDVIEHVMRLLDENDRLALLCVDLYVTAWRDGWEEGETREEVCDRAHSHLCNLGLDPFSEGSGEPERIAALRKRLAP